MDGIQTEPYIGSVYQKYHNLSEDWEAQEDRDGVYWTIVPEEHVRDMLDHFDLFAFKYDVEIEHWVVEHKIESYDDYRDYGGVCAY